MNHRRKNQGLEPAGMSRRKFLQHTILSSLAVGTVAGMPMTAMAQPCLPMDMPRSLVNVMLQGGADLRFLFMPAPSHSDSKYLSLTWLARRALYADDYATYRQMFDNEYLVTRDPLSGFEFGVYRRAAWLKDQFDAGRVAVIANAYCSRNRRHDQSILNADAGEPDLEILNFDRSGWGGRLVEYLGDSVNSVELGNAVSTFNKGSQPGDRLEQVVHAQDMRDFALSSPDENSPATRRNILARALRAYYQARGPEVQIEKPANWPYHVFFQHSSALKALGDRVEDQISSCLPLPEELTALSLYSEEFAQQCRNLYDVCQVPDSLGLGVLSMNYGGWDTHNNEAFEIGPKLEDVFGVDAGLATAMRAIGDLPATEMAPASQLVFYFASDFGRQLVANGAAGTDHGRGTYSILMGEAVRGGLYGKMFPATEARPNADGQVPLKTPGADIEGLTSTERILEAATNWVRPGAGSAVFQGAGVSGLEGGVNLDTLFPV